MTPNSAPSSGRGSGPHPIHVFLGPTSPHSKHLDRFSRFSTAPARDKQTHIHTDHTTSVTIASILCYTYTMHANNTTTQFLPRDATGVCIRGTSHGPVSVCLSVSVSVTSRRSTKTAKRRITQTTPHDSPGTLVF